MINGLTTVNIELTSMCNKSCHMCGRRKIDRDYPEIKLKYGHMDLKLALRIKKQIPKGIVIQYHNNGEPLLYPHLREVLEYRNDDHVNCMDTNGKLLVQKADEIIGNLDTLTVSVIERDPEGEEQYQIVKQFLAKKGNRKPGMIYRVLGEVEDVKRWEAFPGIIAKRMLHSPMGSFNYKKEPVVPEIGICLDFLNHLVIRHDGKVSCCVRFDPKDEGIIGDVNKETLEQIWNGRKRNRRFLFHLAGHREQLPLCDKCEFWGIPKG